MAQVELKNVVKIYDKNKIIDNVSLTVKDKEFLVLVGSSGCGKSTLLRMIAGLEDITQGEIFIDGKCVNNVHPKDRDIAFVFQNYALYPHMSVYENMAFPLKMRKMSKKDIDAKIKEAAQILNLTELLQRKPKQLSGGQRQRVALGRAIVRNPKVFLMDEPLSNLDAKLRVQMRAEIKKLHQKLQTTFIYVTHDQTEALTMGDTIVILNEGKIFQKDTPENIFKSPKNVFVASFSGTYPMNLIEGDVIENKIKTKDIEFLIPNNYIEKLKDKTKVIIGIRPENIRLEKKENDIEKTFNIDFVENTGAIKVVYFKENNIKAVINSKETIEGEKMFFFSPNDIMFFDIQTKELIN